MHTKFFSTIFLAALASLGQAAPATLESRRPLPACNKFQLQITGGGYQGMWVSQDYNRDAGARPFPEREAGNARTWTQDANGYIGLLEDGTANRTDKYVLSVEQANSRDSELWMFYPYGDIGVNIGKGYPLVCNAVAGKNLACQSDVVPMGKGDFFQCTNNFAWGTGPSSACFSVPLKVVGRC